MNSVPLNGIGPGAGKGSRQRLTERAEKRAANARRFAAMYNAGPNTLRRIEKEARRG